MRFSIKMGFVFDTYWCTTVCTHATHITRMSAVTTSVARVHRTICRTNKSFRLTVIIRVTDAFSLIIWSTITASTTTKVPWLLYLSVMMSS